MDGPTVDTHFHLWDLDNLNYKWPRKVEEKAIYRSFNIAQYIEERKQTSITHSIFVEAHNSIEETEWILNIANENDFISGVVGYLSLESHDKLLEELNHFAKSTKLVGCRRILDDEDDGWLAREDVNHGLKIIQDHGLVFDLLIRKKNFKDAEYCVKQHPRLKFIIDHIAKPNMKEGEDGNEWFDGMTCLAKYQNVHCKLSGLVTEADLNNWKPADFIKYSNHVIEQFGIDRIIFGSDWPVCKMAHANLKDVFQLCNKLIENLTAEERAKILGLNAIKFYNLKIY